MSHAESLGIPHKEREVLMLTPFETVAIVGALYVLLFVNHRVATRPVRAV